MYSSTIMYFTLISILTAIIRKLTPILQNLTAMKEFSEYNQQDATFLMFIYFCKTLYMFQTGIPSIIRSRKLHILRRHLSDRYCIMQYRSDKCLRSICSFLLLMMDGKPCLKHVERLTEINKSEKRCILLVVL